MTQRSPRRKTLIGHRGASAYAPEHTLQSYELALQQGADTVEQDLHVTRDGVLVCLHDRTLERTTDVQRVFPDRGQEVIVDGRATRQWFVHDFTIAEVKQLDAGAWFGEQFAGARIATFQEVIDCVGDRGTHCTELKDPEIYETFGVDLLSLFAAVLRKNGLDRPRSGHAPVTMQTFHEPTVRRSAAILDPNVWRVLLIEPHEVQHWAHREKIASLGEFATGIGPGKMMLDACPDIVRWAHEANLRVTPWTFRTTEPGRFDNVRAQMAYYLSVLDVDGVITDNPDGCPQEHLHAS